MQKSFDKKINIIVICARTDVYKTTIGYCGIAHPGHNSKSRLPVKAVFHFRYIIPIVYLPNLSSHCTKN